MRVVRASPEVDVDVESSTVLVDPALAQTELGPPLELRSERRSVPPSLAERYEDIHFLGEGGMGTVYRGRDPRLGRTVALKLLKGSDPELGRRFLQEARSQAKVQHENVCRIYEAGEADGEPFIAMQYIEGEPLSKMAGQLSLEQRVKLMREVSAAVHEAHRLGLIHRDIKPGNIMVERSADGDIKPYVMDFGLAREVADKGETVTGAVLGTPAFMSSEQAKGDVRALDRRSDVYSLGATLYDVVAERPPFVAPHTWKLLMMVAFEEAPALGKVKKGVPADLETIVMKCLERDPGRRYESARALAEDLQRFLDGEPILARRASVGYVLWKKARKHKLATAVSGVLLVAALALAGVWWKARQQAAAEARIAQELGERVKEMELFLRAAYELPLHDVERERDVVRRKLSAIEERMKEAGRVGEGPGHYALGRGYLALGDPEKAREHLEKAVGAGYRSPELEYALGRTLGELYRRALAKTKRITNAEERKKREAELAAALRAPALGHLRAASGAEIEAPAYVEGLIALYEGKNEEARAKAREAFEQAPWMYEAKKLEADALFAEGSKYRHDAAFDWDKMMLSFGPAAEAYKVAAEMAESDPEVHRAECELWEKMGLAAGALGKPAQIEFGNAEATCARAVQSSSLDGAARVERALALYYRFFTENAQANDADAAQQAVLQAVEEAVRVRPRDAMALYALAATLNVRAARQAARGERVTAEDAIAAFHRVLDVEPRFTWALNELGQTYLIKAEFDRLHGEDPRQLLGSASQRFDQAIEVDPSFTLPMFGKIRAAIYRLVYETEHGLEAQSSVDALSNAVALVEQRSLGGFLPAYYAAKSLRVRAAYELSVGKDPRASIAAGLEKIHAFATPGTETGFLLMEVAELRLLEAEHTLSNRLLPVPELLSVRDRVEKVAEEDTWDIDSHHILARLHLFAARARAVSGEAREQGFDAAAAVLRPLVAKERNDPRPYQMLAEIHAKKAPWLDGHEKSANADVDVGLEFAEKALAIHPHSAQAFVAKGELLLVRARVSRGEDRKKAARAAGEAFVAAIRENPRLAAAHQANIQEAKGME
ncbi:serine/threonine-protein kinase [Polyangium jinanense]|uniref:Serine/threonine protein kinase n=1 Tax=Polyangium jinanense TaxID=2829994 RepID=A0A9X4AU01_9BACT|nr:serine/threonine-protein kinase [Polyangium jinanense]MDC3956676.1 serine/threonine protein kinase [Polyangium jinanense]MDC3984739.1 serine/threonine protein kinase [Polyangium jinanense]